jgi:hypothetical protein
VEKRNLAKFTLLVLVFVLFLNILTVFALDYKDYTGSISALSSGYAITRWPTGSGDTYPGQEVVVRAVTTDLDAVDVRIRWIRPDGSIAKNEIHGLVDIGNEYDGADVIEAEDSLIIDMLDIDGQSWGVQAIFLYSDGPVGGPDADPFLSIKAISYHSTPEIPFGTITTIATMLAASGFFILKRK